MNIGRCAGTEGFVGQTGQFKFYSEFNAARGVGLRSMFVVGHASPHELRSFGFVAAF